MGPGSNFLASKLARRFCLLFISAALLPTAALVLLSYAQVVGQFETQSLERLNREVKAYVVSLFDRMIRIEHELKNVGRLAVQGESGGLRLAASDDLGYSELFTGLGIYRPGAADLILHGTFTGLALEEIVQPRRLQDEKPFVVTRQGSDGEVRIFFGTTMYPPGRRPYAVVAEVSREYLWGVGANHLLPPMTELVVYGADGSMVFASEKAFGGDYGGLKISAFNQETRIFEIDLNGRLYYSGIANLFADSHYQKVGWTILLSRSKNDVMSALVNFRLTYPLTTALFLLLVSFLSLRFIRRGLDPLARLKRGTQRIARQDFSALVEIDSGDEFEELGNAFNEMAVRLDKQFSTLQVLAEIDRAILSSLDRKKIIAATLQRMLEFFHCDISLLIRLSAEGGSCVTISRHTRGIPENLGERIRTVGKRWRQAFLVERDVLFLEAGEEGYQTVEALAGKTGLRYLCLPLAVDGRVNQVLFLGRGDGLAFQDEEAAQARQIANLLAIGMTNSLYVEKLNNLAGGAIEALARTVDAKSKWTSGHSERVARLGGRIARAMGLCEQKVETVIRGGLLHDIGKIAIPQAILDKPGALSEVEYEEIKNHPAIGAEILEPIEAYQDILPLVLQHHEHFDGSGYPAGLIGEEIDIRARIIAVADVWDALVSNRPYRYGWLAERARNLIVAEMGRCFDPRVVTTFLVVLAEEAGYEALAPPESAYGRLSPAES